MVCAHLSGDSRDDVLICWSPFRGGTNVRRSVIVRSQLPAQAMMFQGAPRRLAAKFTLYSIEADATHIWVVDVFSPAVLCDTAKHSLVDFAVAGSFVRSTIPCQRVSMHVHVDREMPIRWLKRSCGEQRIKRGSARLDLTRVATLSVRTMPSALS